MITETGLLVTQTACSTLQHTGWFGLPLSTSVKTSTKQRWQSRQWQPSRAETAIKTAETELQSSQGRACDDWQEPHLQLFDLKGQVPSETNSVFKHQDNKSNSRQYGSSHSVNLVHNTLRYPLTFTGHVTQNTCAQSSWPCVVLLNMLTNYLCPFGPYIHMCRSYSHLGGISWI
jgi:hypothetical protein